MSPEQVAIARMFDNLEVVEYGFILGGIPKYANRTPSDLMMTARAIVGEHMDLNDLFLSVDTRDALEWIGEDPDEIIDGPYHSDRVVTRNNALRDLMSFLSSASRLTSPLIEKYKQAAGDEVVVHMTDCKGYLDIPFDVDEPDDTCNIGSRGNASKDVLIKSNMDMREEVARLRVMLSNKDEQINSLMHLLLQEQRLRALQMGVKLDSNAFKDIFRGFDHDA